MKRDTREELRFEIAQHQGGKRRRYTQGLRRRIIAHMDAGRQRGAKVAALAAELGVGLDAYYRWQREEERKAAKQEVRTPSFVPITITEAKLAKKFCVNAGELRIEGLGVDDIVALIRALRC